MKRISIVTGGSSGLGKELARELTANGKTVCIIGRTETKVEATVKEIDGVIGYTGDLSNEEFVKDVFKKLKDSGYYVEALYNCAGVGIFGEPKDMNLEQIKKVMDSNVIGLMCITYEACRSMSEGGAIVNIMSTAALKGNPLESLYCASKWAVRGFTEALRAFYKGKNIHVIGVCPGGIDTPFWTADCGLNPDVSKFMNPAELAKVIVFNTLDKATLYTSNIVIERK